MPSSVFLKVLEADQNDVGFGVARLDTPTRTALGVELGDIVEIQGRKLTGARVQAARKQDEGRGKVRLETVTRRNARVSIGDQVELRKTTAPSP